MLAGRLWLGFAVFLIACKGLAAETAASLDSAALSVGGTGEVTGGAATYRIPILVQSTGGSLEPEVALQYSSRTGRGLAGMGFSLNAGGSQIHRCPPIYAVDGFVAVVNYTATDQLCLDGMRMVAYRGDYGKSGTLYAVELQPGVYVLQKGDLDSPESQFVASAGEEWARLYSIGTIGIGAKQALTWDVNVWIKKNKEFITYHYQQISTGEQVLREIRYTGQIIKDEWKPGKYYVRFNYKQRIDPGSQFIGGEFRYTQILEEIRSGSLDSDVPAHHYRLDYTTSQSSGRELLKTVSACIPGTTFCGGANRIDWRDEKIVYDKPIKLDIPGATLGLPYAPGTPLPKMSTLQPIGDLDGDGRIELMAQEVDGKSKAIFVNANRSIKWLKDIPLATATSGGDLRHVGGYDMVGNLQGSISASSWRRESFTAPEKTEIQSTDDQIVLDVNGDGHRDLVTGLREGKQYHVRLFLNAYSNERKLNFHQPVSATSVKFQPGIKLEAMASLTGTGQSALLRSNNGVEYILEFQTDKQKKLKTMVVAAKEYGMSDQAFLDGHFADLNSDGLNDLVYVGQSGNWVVQMNTQSGFSRERDTGVRDERDTAVARSATFLMDIDADGADELVFPAKSVVEYCVKLLDRTSLCGAELAKREPRMDFGIYRYDAIKFRMDARGRFKPETRTTALVAQANRATVADLHGDGYSDVFSPFDRGVSNGWFRNEQGALVACAPKFGCGARVSSPKHAVSGGTPDVVLDTIKRIRNSQGELSEWTYYTLADPKRNVYSVPELGTAARQLGSHQFYFRSSMPVVGEFKQRDKSGTSRLRYNYGGAVYNSEGIGFDGFRWIVVENPSERLKYGTWFLQDFPYRGTAAKVWIERLSDKENDYQNGSPGRKFVTYDHVDHHCYGPVGHPVSKKFGCLASELPTFAAFEGKPKVNNGNPDESTDNLVEIDKYGRIHVAGVTYVSLKKFRLQHPRPKGSAELKSIWRKILRGFHRAAADGAVAKTELNIDGISTRGEDRYLFGRPPRLHEIRDNRESIAVGQRACTRSIPSEPDTDVSTKWRCVTSGVFYQLINIEWDALIQASVSEVDCGGRCVRLEFVSSKPFEWDFNGKTQRMLALDTQLASYCQRY